MTATEMREKRGQIVEQMRALKLYNDDGTINKETNAKFDLMDKEQDELRQSVERMEKSTKLEEEMRTSRKPGEPPIAGAPGQGGFDDAQVKAHNEKRRKAFVSYLRNGERPEVRGNYKFKGITEEERKLLHEQRDMITGGEGAYPGATVSTGAAFVPVGFVMEIEEALKYYGDMWNQAEIMDTATGQPLPYPTDNDTTVSGVLVGEGAQVPEQDVVLGQIIFGAWKFSSQMVKVSIELLQDSAFDLESYLVKKFAIRLGRATNTYFTIGAGSTQQQPNGIITAATVGVGGSSGTAVIGNDNLTTPDPTQQVGYIDLVNLEHSIDPLYRKGAKFMFHDQTLRYIKTLKDLFGHPLWMPGMAVGKPDTLLGYGYSINNDMAQLGPTGSPAVGSISVAFGPLDKYLIRRVKDMSVMRLVERFADYGQVAFLAFARYDGNLLDAGTHPVKYLQNAA